MKLVKLKPAYKDYLWGGIKLKNEYGKNTTLDKVAESWELSAHQDGPSIVDNGKYKGKTFIEYLNEEGKNIWGTHCQTFQQFPILIKFIDAKEALSIQVHPADEYALRVEKEYGKNELWYILDCEPGSFLYYGVNRSIDKEEFKKRIEENTLLEVLNKVEVKKGDCFFIEAGTIHAIGAGIVICEIQQNSNSTYRVYDFGRVGADGKQRELHIQKAIDVSRLTPSDASGKAQGSKEENDGYARTVLLESKYFTSTEYEVKKEVTLCADETSFHSLLILSGQGKVKMGSEVIEFKKGDSIFVPANARVYSVVGECRFIQTSL